MKTDTSVGTASGFPIPGAVSFQLHNSYLKAPCSDCKMEAKSESGPELSKHK